MAYQDLADIFDPAPDASPPAEWGDQIRDNFEALAAVVLGITAATVATTESTSSTSYADLSTAGPAVTVETGERALVLIGGIVESASDASGIMSFEVSGATTLSAADSRAVSDALGTSAPLRHVNAVYLDSLTPGVNVFTAKYRRSALGSGSATFAARTIIVIPLP